MSLPSGQIVKLDSNNEIICIKNAILYCKNFKWEDFVFGKDVNVSIIVKVNDIEYNYTPDALSKDKNVIIDFKNQFSFFYQFETLNKVVNNLLTKAKITFIFGDYFPNNSC